MRTVTATEGIGRLVRNALKAQCEHITSDHLGLCYNTYRLSQDQRMFASFWKMQYPIFLLMQRVNVYITASTKSFPRYGFERRSLAKCRTIS